MGKSPLSLWDDRPAAPVTARPLTGDWRDSFAQIYDVLASRGIAVPTVDQCEIWEVAAMLGANRSPEESEGAQSDWNVRRAIALERGEPEPTWDDVPVTQADNPIGVSFLREGLIGPPLEGV